MLKVYSFSRVNKFARGNTRDLLRVLWAPEEMGLPYEIVGMDHPNDLDSDKFRAKNPFGQIPLVDDDGVVVTESGAILLYLARKGGKLMPPELCNAEVEDLHAAQLTAMNMPVLALQPV
jgi:glutathione S-transferase